MSRHRQPTSSQLIQPALGWAARNLLQGLRLALLIAPVAVFAPFAGAQVASRNDPATDPAPDYSFILTTTASTVQVDQAVDLVATIGSGYLLGGSPPVYFFDAFRPTDPVYGDPLCTEVPVVLVGESGNAHCVTTFDTPGFHDVIAVLDAYDTSGGIIPETNDVPITVTDPIPFDANQAALTGSWYNPNTAGQGLEVVVYPDPSAAGVSFLYAGEFKFDLASRPLWDTFQGSLSSSHGNAFVVNVYGTSGGNFDLPPAAETVPGPIEVDDGPTTITFYDCTHMTFEYGLPQARRVIPYVRLTSPSGCSNEVPATPPAMPPENYNDALHSGAWYEPATAGQGLIVDIAPAQSTFFAAWYTYAPESEGLTGTDALRWLALQANYTPGDLAIQDVPIYVTSGGIFHEPSVVTRTTVGSANVTFLSCDTMMLDYTFTAGEFAGLTGSIEEHNPAPAPGCQ